MPAYLVRTIDEHDLVGFFYAEEMHDLIIAVDECLDPGDCEYSELPAGGIMWTSPAVAIPLDDGDKDETDEDDKQNIPWARVDLTDSWWDVVHNSSEKWTEFFPGSPREPRSKPTRPLGPGRVLPYRRRT
jgi:hypothetical protein